MAKDVSLTELGCKEISLAEHEMLVRMTCRSESSQPFKGLNIDGSLQMVIQDHATAGIVEAGVATVSAWKRVAS